MSSRFKRVISFYLHAQLDRRSLAATGSTYTHPLKLNMKTTPKSTFINKGARDKLPQGLHKGL